MPNPPTLSVRCCARAAHSKADRQKDSVMKELLLFVAKTLVDNPDEVRVTETEGPEAIILELNVAQDDMGKVIGKQGRIAKAIRSVIKAATSKGGKPVFVEIQ